MQKSPRTPTEFEKYCSGFENMADYTENFSFMKDECFVESVMFSLKNGKQTGV